MLKKTIFLVILFAFLAFVYNSGNAKDISLKSVEKSLVANEQIQVMEKCNDRQLNQFIKLSASSFSEVLYYKNQEALRVDELLIVKLKDKSQTQIVNDAIDERIASQIKIFDGYGPEQVAQLKNAKIFNKGNYVFFCVSKKPDKVAEVFKNAI
ncbi:protein of unknown function [Peptostreptococcaceae bacterium pGA-8]|nr:protein of unknown function [Peptostreptococcaceae bacterium pGA-8]